MKKLYSILMIAFFAATASAQCSANLAVYDTASYIYGDNLSTGAASYEWWVYDGAGGWSTHTTASLWHGPVAAGTYTVCLYAYDSAGMFCDSTCSSITIAGSGSSCNASFSASVSGSSVNFSDFSSASALGGVASWSWDFGDGNSSTLQNPMHTYAAGGVYTVCLTITDGMGCSDTHCSVVSVSGGPGGGSSCSMDFTAYDTAGTIYGDNNSTGAVTTEWYVYDPVTGSSSTYSTWDLTYPTSGSGSYWVCLIGYDSTGMHCDSTCQIINITGGGTGSGSSCAADFIHWEDTLGGGTQFWDISTGSGFNYFWDFGDGNTATVANPYHTYASAGTYNVCLTVWNSTCADTICDIITITGGGASAPCDADFIWFPDSSTNTVYLWNLGSGPAGLSYFWDFGDGNTSTSAYPMHTYATNGIYNVCLTVTGSSALGGTCTDTYCDSIWVPLKSSGFTINVVAPGGPTSIEEQPALTDGVIFPNPVNDNAQIRLSSNASMNATIMVSSVDGKICSTQNVNINSGDNTFDLNVDQLSSGLYMVTISNGSRLGSYKFVKN